MASKKSLFKALPPPLETKEQQAFVAWFRLQYRGVRIFAIPNGGSRNKIEAKKLKDEGVTSGVPDTFIPEWKLWIEFKRIKGSKTPPEQKDWKAYLESCGYTVIHAKGASAARNQVLEFVKERGL